MRNYRRPIHDALAAVHARSEKIRAANPSMTEAEADVEAYRQLRAEEIAGKMESVRRKAQRTVAQLDVGRRMEIRLDRKTTLEGEVVAARVAEVRQNGSAIEAVFELDLKCGISSFPRTIRVTKLPVR